MKQKDTATKIAEEVKSNLISLESPLLKITWKVKKNTYGPDTNMLFVGGIKVAVYHFNGMMEKGSNLKYIIDSCITQLIPNIKEFETEEQAKDMCMKITHLFIKKLQS